MKSYIYFAIGVAWVLSLTGIGYWQYGEGIKSEHLKWQIRENTELSDANNKIIILNEKIRKKEADHAQSISDISTNYQKELNDANKQNRSLTDAVRSGKLRLRYSYASCQGFNGSDTSASSTSASGYNGGTGANLSKEASEFLLELTGEADSVVRQLKACQEIVKEDRDGI